MKHLLIAASLSVALLADAIILDDYRIDNSAIGTADTYVKHLCIDGYEWINTRLYSMTTMNQVFIENNNNRSTPKKCNMDFKHKSQLAK